jgi:nucleoside-diphosphate-sugar epimerase
MSSINNSSYGTLKRIGEFYSNSLSGMSVRFWNVYGYEEDNEKTHVITDFIKKAINFNEIKIIGDGTDERQFLYVDDCCECLEMLMNKYDEIDKSNSISISNFKWNNILDVANIISTRFGNCKIVKTENEIGIKNRNREEPDDYILKLWKPKIEIDDGINKIIDRYLTNRR